VDELMREFIIESQDGLDCMERCLTELEDRPRDGELLADIFRSVHTIKGTTGFLGFTRLEVLSHAGENLLGMLRDGALTANADVVNALLELVDGLRAILQSIEASGEEGNGSDDAILGRLESLLDAAAIAEGDIWPGLTTHSSQSGRAYLGTLPGAAANQSRQLDYPVAGHSLAQSTTADSTLRVGIDLLNQMMNLVGELVLTRNQILQASGADPGFTPLARRLDMVTADLREAVMKARMQPVSHVFSKFPRLVRDLSRQLDKRVCLRMEGQSTELDRSLLEAIRDPLTHLVRNAIDHGIEAPHLREAAGKNPEGSLTLRARQESGHVIVEVIDDGGGIRVERIRDKAIERRLITAQKAAQLADRELLQLIFLPGFSTAEKITSISGRGVGMDVVRMNVDKIGGKVEIDSWPGRGTTLRLRIPLTLAIIPALIVRSCGQNFALPQSALCELVHLTADGTENPIEWLENVPLYRLRGRLLPLIFLTELLAQGKGPEGETGRYIAILNADGRRFGLVVDGLADTEEIVVKPLSSVLKKIGLFSGATVMGNGDMALILDPGAIAVRSEIDLSDDEGEDPNGEATRGTDNVEYLFVEAGGEQAALPLATVLRIERIPRGRVERIGNTPVLRFNDTLLPLQDSAGVFEGQWRADAEMTVVVCRDGERHVGVVVSQVLDVAAGAPLAEAGTQAVAAGVTLLKERVTGVMSLSRLQALPAQAEGVAR
jgi:two-component system, chemotaxis family, sensor kinase CheA